MSKFFKVRVLSEMHLLFIFFLISKECEFSDYEESLLKKSNQYLIDTDTLSETNYQSSFRGFGFWSFSIPLLDNIKSQYISEPFNNGQNQDGQLLFVIKHLEQNEILSVGYLFFDYQSREVNHIINLYNNNEMVSSVRFMFPALKYEGVWVFHLITFEKNENNGENFYVEATQNTKTQVGQILSNSYEIFIGGNGLIMNLNLNTFIGRLSKIIQIRDSAQTFDQLVDQCSIPQKSNDLQQIQIVEGLKNFDGESIFKTSFEHSGQNYYVSGWVRYRQINERKDYYTLMRLSGYQISENKQKLGDELFALEVELINNIPAQSRIIILADTYNTPFAQSFQQQYEKTFGNIINDQYSVYQSQKIIQNTENQLIYNGLIEWHFIQYEFFQSQDICEMHLIMYFFNELGKIDLYLGNEIFQGSFTNSIFYFTFGGDNFNNNYLQGDVSDFKIIYQYSDNQIQKNDLRCHFTCLTCSGPQNNNCLSCKDEQNRYYLEGLKICQCFEGYFEVANGICQSLQNLFPYLIFQTQQTNVEQCLIGYFRLPNSNGTFDCKACPQNLDENGLSCIDCILYSKSWYIKPVCRRDMIRLSVKQNTPYFIRQRAIDEQDVYLIGNDREIQIYSNYEDFCFGGDECSPYLLYHNGQEVKLQCRGGKVSSDDQRGCLDIFDQYCSYVEKPQFWCDSCVSGYYTNGLHCIKCPSICLTCNFDEWEWQLGCDSCIETYGVLNGQCQKCGLNCSICKQEYNKFIKQDYLKCYKCENDYESFISLEGVDCKMKTIQNCLYSFQTLSYDYSINTLDINFAVQNDTTSFVELCSICELGFMFIFEEFICITINDQQCDFGIGEINLLTNEYNLKECLITSDLQSSISNIQFANGCSFYNANCKSCLETDTINQYFCLECKSGYYASKLTGNCIQCPIKLYCSICIQQDIIFKNHWKNKSRAFYRKYIEILDGHYFTTYAQSQNLDDYEIKCSSCQQGYRLLNSVCIPYCYDDCAECILFEEEYHCIKCHSTKKDFYPQTLENNQCVQCAENCKICSSRTQVEVQAINPLFNNLNYKKYSNQCLVPMKNNGFDFYDENFGVFFDCDTDQGCEKIVIIEYNLFSNSKEYQSEYKNIIDSAQKKKFLSQRLYISDLINGDNSFPNHQNDQFYQIINQFGARKLLLKIISHTEELSFQSPSEIKQKFSESIFTLIEVDIELYFNTSYVSTSIHNLYFTNFKRIRIENLNFGGWFSISPNLIFQSIFEQEITLKYINQNYDSVNYKKIPSFIFQNIKSIEIDGFELKAYYINFFQVFTINSTLNDIEIILKNFKITGILISNTQFFYFYLNQQARISMSNFSLKSTFLNFSLIKQVNEITSLSLNNIQLSQSYVNNSNSFLDFSAASTSIINNLTFSNTIITDASLLNIYKETVMQNVIVQNCTLIGSSKVMYNSYSKNIKITILNILFSNNSYLTIVKFIEFQRLQSSSSSLNIYNISLKNNYLLNKSLIYNQYQEQSSLILIEVDYVEIYNYHIERGPGIIEMYFKNVTNIQLQSGLITQTDYSFKGIHQDIICQLYQSQGKFYPSSIFIFSVETLKVQNLTISKVTVYDFPIFSYYSSVINEEIQKLTLQFDEIIISDNVQLQTESVSLIGLISFMCYQKTIIAFSSSKFLRNIFQMYEQSQDQNSAGLITIVGYQNIVSFNFCQFEQNFVINGSSSILYVSGSELSIQNSQFLNNSILIYDVLQPNLIWGYEDLQNIYLETIENVFQIKSQTGIGILNVNNVYMDNNIFNASQGYKGGCFKITSQNTSIITITNSQFFQINTLFKYQIENGGVFYIETLSNFKQQINFQNITVTKIYCKSKGGFLYINSLSSNIIITLNNATFNDIYSNQGSIIFSSFQPDYQMNTQFSSNQLIFQNSLEGYYNYLNNYKTNINLDLLKILINNRSLIFLENCEVLLVENAVIQNLLYEAFIDCENSTNLLLNNILIFNSTAINKLIQFTPSEDLPSYIYLSSIQIFSIKLGFELKNNICNESSANITFQKFICLQSQANSPIQLKKYDGDTQNDNVECLLIEMFTQLDIQEAGVIQFIGLNQKSEIKLNQITINSTDCSICKNGLILITYIVDRIPLIQKILKLKITQSDCGKQGCLILNKISDISKNRLLSLSYNNQNFYELIIKDYNCFQNTGWYGTCLKQKNIQIWIKDCYFSDNSALYIGGAIYTEGIMKMIIENSVIEKNSAYISGGIYLKDQATLDLQKLNTIVRQNKGEFFGDNLVSIPFALTLLISGMKLETTLFKHTSNEKIDQIKIQKYETVTGHLSDYLMIPTGQQLSAYNFFDYKNKIYIKSNLTLRIIALGQDFETIKNLNNTNCTIRSRSITNDNQDHEFTNNYTSIAQIQFDSNTQTYSLDDMIVYFDNNISNSNYLQLEFLCSSIEIPMYSNEYPYQILKSHSNYRLRANFKTYQCQFGEIKNLTNFACEKCDSTQGLFSLILNQQKCNIIDESTTYSVFNSKLNLRLYYWRPYFDTSDVSYCLNLPENCFGGWIEGDNSCYLGHIGALCEQCDLYDIRGDGRFSVSDRFSCTTCQEQMKNQVFIAASIIITQIFLFISVSGNLKNIEENHRFKPIHRSTLTSAITKTQSSILMKMFTNYLQIVASITTFQLQFPTKIQSTINAVGNPIQSATYTLDCFLINLFSYEIQYGRMIWQLITPFIYINFFLLIFSFTTKFQFTNFNSSVITTTFIYIFIYFQPNLIGGFIQLLSYRKISGFQWIQANVAQRYDTSQHFLWIVRFSLPMSLIIAIIIPTVLFLLLFKNRFHLSKRSTRLHWGYLYNEYKINVYYWELIKIIQKTLIILSLNYYQDTIVIKGILVLFITYIYQELNSIQQPYHLAKLNKLDYQSANISMITFSLAIGAYISQTTSISELQIPFYFMIGLLNLFFLQLILGKIIEEYLRSFETILDIIRDKIREQFPSLNSGYFSKLLRNRGKQRKTVLERFQRVKKLLIPIIKKSIKARTTSIDMQKSVSSAKQLQSEIATVKINEYEIQQDLLSDKQSKVRKEA